MRRLPVLAAAVVLAVALTGCSGEEPPYDDGSQSVPLAGLSTQVEDAGVEVVAPARPALASLDQVVDALDDADVASPTVLAADDDTVSFDASATAGLLGVVGDEPGTTLVLVFTGPDAAAVFAAGDPEVFADAGTERSRDALLAGNLVGYATPDADGATRLRTALDALAGVASPSSSRS